jgi:hypothetical protein
MPAAVRTSQPDAKIPLEEEEEYERFSGGE